MTSSRHSAIVWALWALACGACAGYRDRPATVDARSYYYRDDNGLSVSTTGVSLEQPVASRVALTAQALVDHISLERKGHTHVDDSGQATGHQHDDVDAVSSASVSTTRGLLQRETRYENTLGASYYGDTARGPLSVSGFARVSLEPDYRSYAGRARVSWELSETGTTLGAVAGYGHDLSDPRAAPPGEEGEWPAVNQRVQGGATLAQLLSRRLVGSAGVMVSHQFGRLESPYRRARVRTSLFPERLPARRTRSTAFLSLSSYLGWDSALHLRLGGYADSWRVLSLSPEAALSKQAGERGLVTLRYRFYRQTDARFYRLSYDDLVGHRTGDARLGRVREHEVAGDASLMLVGGRGERRSLLLTAGYGLLLLDYLTLQRGTLAHVASLGLSGSY